MQGQYQLIVFDGPDLLIRNYLSCLENAKVASNEIDGLQVLNNAIKSSVISAENLALKRLAIDGHMHFTLWGIKKLLDVQEIIDNVIVKSRDTEGYFESASLILAELILSKGSKWSVSERWPVKIDRPTEEGTLIVSTDILWAKHISEKIDWEGPYGYLDRESFIKRYGFPPDQEKIITYKSFRGKTGIDSALVEITGFSEETLKKVVNEFSDIDDIGSNIYSMKIPVSEKDAIRHAVPDAKINKRIILSDNYDNPENEVIYGEHNKFVTMLWEKVLNEVRESNDKGIIQYDIENPWPGGATDFFKN